MHLTSDAVSIRVIKTKALTYSPSRPVFSVYTISVFTSDFVLTEA